MKNSPKIIALFACFTLIFITTSTQAQLVINELMASNDSLVADEAGEYDDWLEIYNRGDDFVNLSGYFLSDRFTELDKWAFPAGYLLAPDSYLTVWVDKDEEQGDLHTSFKLSGGGEQIILSSPNLEILDSTSFGSQITDLSLARVPNGTGPFTFHTPTFGASNDEGEALDTFVLSTQIIDIQNININPNPAQSYLNITFKEAADFPTALLKLRDLTGKIVLEQRLNEMNELINLPQLPNSLYLLSIETSNQRLYTEKILIER